MAVSAEALARAVLPAPLYGRFSRSPLAKRLVSGSLWSLAGSATSRILNLVAMVLVARTLGQISFGEFGLVQTTLGVAGLMAGVGLGGTATRFVAQYGIVDPTRAGRVIALVSSASWGAALIVSGLLVAASPYVAREGLAAPHLQSALGWGALLLLVTVIRGIQNGILAGLEQFNAIAKLSVSEGVASLVAVVALASLTGIDGALLGLALGSAIALLAGRFVLARVLRERRIEISYSGCWRDWKILTSYSFPSLLASLVTTPGLWFSMALLARAEHGYAALGTYNAAFQWHAPLMFVPMILTTVSTPILVQEWENGQRRRFRKLAIGMCGLALAITLPLAIPVAMLGPWIMGLYGPGFDGGGAVLALLVAAAPLHALAHIGASALLGMNRAWNYFWAHLAWGATMCALAAWLVPAHGALGLAAAFLTAYAVLATATLAFSAVGSRTAPRE